MRPAHERHIYIVTTPLIGWAYTYTSPCWQWVSSIGHELTNTAFSHSNKECSPYSLVITHQTKARDDIDGLMQERRNSIAKALGHVFLAPSHPYKECHLWVPPPLPLLFPFLQCNEINMTMLWVFFNSFIGQCTEHIASHYIVPRHIESTILRLSNSWYPTTSTTPNTYIDYWSQTDAVQSLNVVPSICHWYCVTLVCLVLIISRWWGWTNMQLLKCNIFVSV